MDPTVKKKFGVERREGVSFLTIFVRKKHPSHRPKPFPAYSDGMTTIYLGRLTHIPCFSKTPYRRTAIPFQPIVEQAKKEYQKLLSQSNTAICQYPSQYP